jgi:hypothetical protein
MSQHLKQALALSLVLGAAILLPACARPAANSPAPIAQPDDNSTRNGMDGGNAGGGDHM